MNKKQLLNLKTIILLSTLATTTVGCSKKNVDEPITKQAETQNQYKLLVLNNQKTRDVEYYLTNEIIEEQEKNLVFHDYYDIFTNENIYYESYDDNILFDKTSFLDKLGEYDVKVNLDMNEKKQYTKEEIQIVLDDVLNNSISSKYLAKKKRKKKINFDEDE